MRVAIIDLGTNTCNLLVAEIHGENYKILHRSKQLVKLGDGKINTNEISQEATQRTIDSFCAHKQIIEQFQVEHVRVLATSAVRTAKNKIQYLNKLGEASGWLVKLVSGEQEAELIFKGVLQAMGSLYTASLILDIGGGSNEFILAHEKNVLWKESQAAGMARVINSFQLSEPILGSEVVQLHAFFIEKHQAAFRKCKQKSVHTLIGCSGAFDTIADLIDEVNSGAKQRIKQEIKVSDFYDVYEKVKKTTREERLRMKGMDCARVDLIVPAMVLVDCVISETGIEKIIQTDFALREGVLSEIMETQLKV